mgnify:CR=1 FL=1
MSTDRPFGSGDEMPLVPLFALLLDTLEGATHELTFQGGDEIDEQFAMEMVDLVLQDPGVESLRVEFEGLSILIEGGDIDVGITGDLAVHVWNTQATLLGGGHALADVDDGVHESDGRQTRFGGRNIDDNHPPRNADLRRCQSDRKSVV